VLIRRDAISSVTIALLRQLISWDNGGGRDANPVTQQHTPMNVYRFKEFSHYLSARFA